MFLKENRNFFITATVSILNFKSSPAKGASIQMKRYPKTIEDSIPYRLVYYATEKDYQKYLQEFEQMVKTFKFAK